MIFLEVPASLGTGRPWRTSSCSLGGGSVGAAGGERPSEGAKPRGAARLGLAMPREDLSLGPLVTPSKVYGLKMDRLGQSLQG